ncbi:MAG: Ig-like domain-containing protein, partial [Eubacterium sp.]|nr:Ig-like domain-containing protein [Eubacterium sp.]
MRKVKFLSVIKISTVVLSMVAGFTGATYGVNSVYAEDVEIRDNIETSASSGKIIIGVEGYDYTSAQQDIIERINEIRHEACYAGNVPNPNKTSEYLKPSDYKPIQLGVSCTKAATIRSAEGAVRLAHVRPNSYACNTVLSHFLGSSMVSSAENLAWSNDHSSDLEQWYGEKKYWVDKNTSYETGHYTTLINPNYTYCGIATFNPDNDEIYTSSGWKADWCCTAGSFSSTDVAIAENNYKDKQNKPVIQKMEMTPSNVINITPIGNPLLHVGDNSKFELVVDVKYSGAANCTVKNCSVYDGITWSSSDSTIVSINSSTGAVSAKKTGQVTITATMGSGSSIKKKEFDCVVVPAGVEPVEAVDPDMVTVESYKTPTLSNSVSIKLSDGTSIEVSPIWDSYNSSLVQTHFKSTEFNVTGKACGLDVVQKVHVNAAKITNVFCEEKQGDTYIKVTSKTTDSGTSVSYPSCGISLSNGLTWTYPATWTTRQKQNYKNRAGGTFTEEGYTTVSTDEGSKKLEISFELIVNPASVTSVVYDEKEITTPSGTEPVYPVATVKWTNGDIDDADSPGAEYGYIKWVQTDDFKNAYKKRNGGSYEITGTYYDAVNDVSYSDSTTVTVNVTPATVTSVVYDDDEIVVENGTSPVSKLPKK